MHKYIIYSCFIISFIGLFFILKGNFSVTTMKYFPLDDNVFFDNAETNINFLKSTDEIEWSVESTSSDVAYLRQDVSLLYENGKFKGVLNKWRQNVDHLDLSKHFIQSNSSLLQAISFHHGEIHYPNDQISSIQKMTSNQLYFIRDSNTIYSFHEPSNANERKWERDLNKMTHQQLDNHWTKLINQLDIAIKEYDSIPLTELAQYENKPLPGRTEAETKKIIGQLWEGLYKNYILLLKEEKNRQDEHYMPLILLAKNNDHLLVIFELNNKNQKLIQQIS
ncbi:hypothetical protein [Pseudogracilibacillus sp. SO30301A]|uniref:hypothetical protein n=1 Tax=Pseudogracilibacillus sp. SO30301A TaxID=3098291 RepID=UPI00300DFE43